MGPQTDPNPELCDFLYFTFFGLTGSPSARLCVKSINIGQMELIMFLIKISVDVGSGSVLKGMLHIYTSVCGQFMLKAAAAAVQSLRFSIDFFPFCFSFLK